MTNLQFRLEIKTKKLKRYYETNCVYRRIRFVSKLRYKFKKKLQLAVSDKIAIELVTVFSLIKGTQKMHQNRDY